MTTTHTDLHAALLASIDELERLVAALPGWARGGWRQGEVEPGAIVGPAGAVLFRPPFLEPATVRAFAVHIAAFGSPAAILRGLAADRKALDDLATMRMKAEKLEDMGEEYAAHVLWESITVLERNLARRHGLTVDHDSPSGAGQSADHTEHDPAARWQAPLTPAQAVALNEYQRGPNHEYTCGLDSTHPPLVAYKGGWYCKECEYTQLWAHPVEVTARHHLIAAELVTHSAVQEDGYTSIVEAADRALSALTEAGYRLLPPGAEARTYTDYGYGGWEGLDEHMARTMRAEGKDVEQRTVTEYATSWEPFRG